MFLLKGSTVHPTLLAVGGAAFAVAFIGLLVAEKRRSVRGMAVAKPLASALFVALALARGGLDSDWGRWIVIGLGLSWVGDAFLVPRENPVAFRAALASFLVAHVAYVFAFGGLGASLPAGLVVGVAALMPAGIIVTIWLEHHVPKPLWFPVLAYIVVISVMVAAAAGAYVEGATAWILGGAIAFYLSDITVARDRFVAPGFRKRLVGLPLYYGGQLALAWSVGA